MSDYFNSRRTLYKRML